MATVSIKNATNNIILLEATEIVTGTVTSYSIAHNMSAVVPGTGGTNLGKAEDGTHASGDVGVAFLGVRRDTAASGAGADGDYATINLDSTGKVWVTGVYLEDAASASADKLIAIGAVRKDTRSVGSDTDGDYSHVAMNAQGDVYVQASQKRALFESVPTTAAGTYAAGDVVGTLMTISNATRFTGGSGVIENIAINDKANVVSNLDIIFFKDSPSASTFTDNGAYTVNAADWDEIIAAANVDNVYAAAGNRTNQYTPPAGIPFVTVGTTLYAVLVCRTSFVLASATDIKVALTIRQD